jgi:hypothetical protein
MSPKLPCRRKTRKNNKANFPIIKKKLKKIKKQNKIKIIMTKFGIKTK